MTEEETEAQVIAVSEIELTCSLPVGDGSSIKEYHIKVSSGTPLDAYILFKVAQEAANDMHLRSQHKRA